MKEELTPSLRGSCVTTQLENEREGEAKPVQIRRMQKDKYVLYMFDMNNKKGYERRPKKNEEERRVVHNRTNSSKVLSSQFRHCTYANNLQ
jgi:hypothetical protein